MRFFSNAISIISLIGVRKDVSRDIKKKVIIVNQFSALGFLAILASSFYHIDTTQLFYSYILYSVFYIFVILFNQFKFHNLSRIAFCVLTSMSIVFLGSTIEHTSSYIFKIFLLFTAIFPVILFTIREKWLISIGLLWITLFIVLFEPLRNIIHQFSLIEIPTKVENTFSFLFSILISVALFFLVIYLQNLNNRAESELNSLLSRSNEQNAIIKAQNEKLQQRNQEIEKQKENIFKKNEELITLNQEKNHLISIVSHDLRNPLNQIKGLVDILRMTLEKNATDEQTELISRISNTTESLNAMVKKILDINAIESKKLNIHLEKTNLSDSIRSSKDLFDKQANKKNITITWDINKCYAKVDIGYFKQITENLISNAIKYTYPKKHIVVKLFKKDKKARFEVTDEGPGISKEEQKKLFLKFQKLSTKPTGGEHSTGLGLSIVKKYVEAMKGKVWCESKLEHGSTFIVEFDAS